MTSDTTSNGSENPTTNGQDGSESPSTITIGQQKSPDEWVEIIEPNSRMKIYANLESGMCAKKPPDGVSISRVEDFSDHWWELYDEKTGKFYYYNPDQQKTAWTKPEPPNSQDSDYSDRKKKLLIIPVSRLQTFKKNSHNQMGVAKCDASTQTCSANLVSTSTQTSSVDEFKDNSNSKAKIFRKNRASEERSNDESDYNPQSEGSMHLNLDDYNDFDDVDHSPQVGTNPSEPKRFHDSNWQFPLDRESSSSPADGISRLNLATRSPLVCETSSLASNFTFNELINDEKDPSTCLTQQLDNRKLIENFRKSRQTSSFGTHDLSLGRSSRIDPYHAMQKIRMVADGYFSNEKNDTLDTEKHLRQVSILSTLPRPHKDIKSISSKQEDINNFLDADYDVVEENCGYFSDSEQSAQLGNVPGYRLKASNPDDPGSETHFDRNQSTRGSTFSVESFARENLSKHAMKGGGFFHRKVNWSKMISWTKSGIKHPMISSVGADLSSEAIASFKLIQQFMGDREVTMGKKYRQLVAQSKSFDIPTPLVEQSSEDKNVVRGTTNTGNPSHITDRLRDELAFELILKGCTQIALRDEIYIQLARQLTDNPSQESVRLGLVMMSILLSYFSPSVKFAPFLIAFLESHPHQMARDVCLPRLMRRLRQNWIPCCRKPTDGNEVTIVRFSITKWPQYCGVFGESLEHIMSLQNCSTYLKTLRLPWILTTLGEKLLQTGGAETEGIFRCAADHDLIAQLRLEIDCVDFRKITDAKQVHSLLSNVQDPHVIAGLLKLFFRQMKDPVFPTQLYEHCLGASQDGQAACRIFNEHLPNLNKDVVAYLIRLLQLLSRDENVTNTKMDSSNLSMVWAPNLLKAAQNEDITLSGSGSKWSISNWISEDHNHDTSNSNQQKNPAQSLIFEQTRQEMQFIRALITSLDTSFIEKVT